MSNFSLADKESNIWKFRSDFTRDAMSVVDVDLVFTLASSWCLFPPSDVSWMDEHGDFYTKLWWDDLTASKLTKPVDKTSHGLDSKDKWHVLLHNFKNHSLSGMSADVTETLRWRWVRFCLVTFSSHHFNYF